MSRNLGQKICSLLFYDFPRTAGIKTPHRSSQGVPGEGPCRAYIPIKPVYPSMDAMLTFLTHGLNFLGLDQSLLALLFTPRPPFIGVWISVETIRVSRIDALLRHIRTDQPNGVCIAPRCILEERRIAGTFRCLRHWCYPDNCRQLPLPSWAQASRTMNTKTA